MTLSFRARLKKGDLLTGTLITLAAPEVAEIMAEIGYDWLFIDCEHTSFNAQGAHGILQAVDYRCPCVIRIPANTEVWIKKALDIGAAGIIAPGVNSAQEAEQIVRLCKYPPRGTRGVGIARAHGYGLKFKEYIANANDQVAVIVQAENTNAVKNIFDIVEVPDIDAVLIGPYDLSASMGKMGNIKDAEIQAAMERVLKACRDAGVPVGIFADSAESAAPLIQRGYTLIALSTDCLHMAQGAKAQLKAIKNESSQR